jgi:mono/diheme cytochrome c family protein
MKAVLRAFLLVLVVFGLGAGVVAYTIASRGLSTRTRPSGVEAALARSMRSLATPRAVRDAVNPVARSPAVLDEALSHYADHCAVCHANDGSGETAIGRNVYPPAPDMRRRETQALADGELFSIIENGIRLTAMPAWGNGTPDGERASWGLVHFIRHLPHVTPEELARMEELNPKSPEQFREEEESRRFLAGEDAAPNAATPHQDRHK